MSEVTPEMDFQTHSVSREKLESLPMNTNEKLNGKGEIQAHHSADQSMRKAKCCKIVLILGVILLIVGAILTGVILGR